MERRSAGLPAFIGSASMVEHRHELRVFERLPDGWAVQYGDGSTEHYLSQAGAMRVAQAVARAKGLRVILVSEDHDHFAKLS